MPLTAAHGSGVVLDVTAPVLGDGVTWEQVHRARPRANLTCRGCGGGLHAKVSPLGFRFFAHDQKTDCPLTGETVNHRLLKAELAAAVRDAGWHAELEVAGTGASPWRADVLATSPDGTRRVAFEAQLSPITPDQIVTRTDNYTAAGVEVCWVAERVVPWVGHAPYLVIIPDEEHHLTVELGVWKFIDADYEGRPTGDWERVAMPLGDAVSHICAARITPHTMHHIWGVQVADKYLDLGGRTGVGHRAWTAPHYIRRHEAHATALAEWEPAQQEAEEAWRRNTEALVARQRALIDPTIALLDQRAGRPGTVATDRACDPFWAMGVPIKSTEGRRWVVSVVCPVASRITDEVGKRLATVLVVVASTGEQQRLERVCRPRQRFHVFPNVGSSQPR